MAEDIGSGGQVTYRVKDLLGEINVKLDRVMDKLDQKADRADVHDLKTRVATLELTTLRREGPIMDDLKEYERRVLTLERAQEQQAAINRDRETHEGQTFSRREKVAGLFLAALAVGFQFLGPIHGGHW